MFSYLPAVSLPIKQIWDILRTSYPSSPHGNHIDSIFLTVSALGIQLAGYVLDIRQLRFFSVFTVRIGNYPFLSMLFC